VLPRDGGGTFSPFPAIVTGVRLGVGGEQRAKDAKAATLDGGLRSLALRWATCSRPWHCASAMSVARCVLAGCPSYVVSGGGAQTLIWI
jgi:hypothetical protein